MDLIERQAAIDAIKTWGLLDGLSEGQAIEILADEEKLPSAQPEIVRWIPTDNESFKQCSECGRHVYAYKYPNKAYPYCHCGAKMENEGW